MRFSRITIIFFSNIALVSSAPINLSSSFSTDLDAAGYHNEYPQLHLRAEMLSNEDGWNGRDDPKYDGYHYANDQTLYRHGNLQASYQNIQRRQPPRRSVSSRERQSPDLVGKKGKGKNTDREKRYQARQEAKIGKMEDYQPDSDAERRKAKRKSDSNERWRMYKLRKEAAKDKKKVPHWAQKREGGRPKVREKSVKRMEGQQQGANANASKAADGQPPSPQPLFTPQPPSTPSTPSTPPLLPSSKLVGQYTPDPFNSDGMVWSPSTPQHPSPSPQPSMHFPDDVNSTPSSSSRQSSMHLSDYADSSPPSRKSSMHVSDNMNSTPSPPMHVQINDFLKFTPSPKPSIHHSDDLPAPQSSSGPV